MGKIISSVNITPDGFVDAQYTSVDADFFEFTHELASRPKFLQPLKCLSSLVVLIIKLTRWKQLFCNT